MIIGHELRQNSAIVLTSSWEYIKTLQCEIDTRCRGQRIYFRKNIFLPHERRIVQKDKMSFPTTVFQNSAIYNDPLPWL